MNEMTPAEEKVYERTKHRLAEQAAILLRCGYRGDELYRLFHYSVLGEHPIGVEIVPLSASTEIAPGGRHAPREESCG